MPFGIHCRDARADQLTRWCRWLAVVLLIMSSAHLVAVDRTWDGGGSTNDWSEAANWDGDATAPTTNDNLIFAGTTKLTNSNNLAADIVFDSITFTNTAGAFVISGNRIVVYGTITNQDSELQTLSLAIGGGFTVDASSGPITLSGSIGPSSLITKNGSQALTLSGSDDNAGLGLVANGGTVILAKTSSGSVHAIGGSTVTINSGATVRLGGTGGDQIYFTGDLVINAGGVFDINGLSEMFDGLSGAGSLTNAGGGTPSLTVGGDNASTTFSGVLSNSSGTLALRKMGSGTLTLSGINTHSGGTAITAGTLSYAADSVFSGTGAIELGGGKLLHTGASTLANAFSVSASSAIESNDGDDLILTGNTISGTAGTLLSLVTTGGDLANTHGLIFQGSGFTYVGNITSDTWSRPKFDNASGTQTFSGVISGTPGAGSQFAWRARAGGTTIMSGANTYSGRTLIDAGTLRLAGGAAIPDGSAVELASTANAVLDLNGTSETVGSLAGGTNAASITLGAGTLTTGGDNTSTTFSGIISGTGAVTKIGSGTQAFAGTQANTYSGTTTVSAGTLHVNKTAGVNAVAGPLALTGGNVTFAAHNQIADTVAVTMSSGVFNGTDVNVGNLVGVNETIASLTMTGGCWNHATSSTWTITGAVSVTGGAGNPIVLGNSGAHTTVGSLSLTAMTATAGGTIATGNSFTIYGNNATQSILTVGTGGLTLNGSVLNLRRGSSGMAGSRLVLNGPVTTSGSTASTIAEDIGGGANGALTLDLASAAGAATRTITVASGTSLAISVPITDGAATPGALIKAGPATLTLSGQGSYSGGTTVTDGIVALAGSGGAVTGPIGTGTITLNSGANTARILLHGGQSIANALVMTNANPGVGQGALHHTGSGAATWSGAITINADNANGGHLRGGATIADVLVLSGTLTTGGTLTRLNHRSGFVRYSGTPGTIPQIGLAGTAQWGVANAFPASIAVFISSSGNSGDTGTLDLNGFNQTIGDLTFQNAGGGIVTTGAGTLTVNGAIAATFTGTLDGGVNTISGNLNLGGATRTLTVADSSAASDLTISAVISNGGLTKVGAGRLTLSGANTYTGGTIITAGTLNYGSDAVFSGNGAIQLNGGTLRHINTSTLANALSVTASSTIESDDGDDLTFSSGTITATPGTVLSLVNTANAGLRSLVFSGNGFTYAGDINLDSNSRVLLSNTSGRQIFSGAITGLGNAGEIDGAIKRSGVGGITTLSGVNTYTGTTQVDAGTLSVTGSTLAGSAVTINSGGTLSGSGTVGGTVLVNNGGTIAPGVVSSPVASFVATSLRAVTQDDWRLTQTITGTRIDPTINYGTSAYGTNVERLAFGIGGDVNNWENFSVQWDGWLTVATPGTTLSTRSDDGSRVWLDLNSNGTVDSGEWGSNGWGNGQGASNVAVHAGLAAGTYRMRIQHEDGDGGNVMHLLWDDAANSAGTVFGLYVVPATLLEGGTSIATLTTGAVTMNATSGYQLDLDGTDPTFDKINTGGAVSCAGALTINSIANAGLGEVYTIINAGSRSGTFSGLAHGDLFTQQGRVFQIAYTGTTVTLTDVAHPTTRIWDGGGADNNWTTGANWDYDIAPQAGDALQFAGTTRLTPNNDYPAETTFASITFNSGAGAFTIGPSAIGTGTISREVWTGIGSTNISTIPLTTTPNISDTLTSLEAPTDWANQYGTRVRGFITAPASGNYTFWLASDDDGELWLSTDHQAANKVLIASVTGSTGSRNWNVYVSQKSAEIALVAGQKYYVEVLQKEDGGGDNLAVGWAKPGEGTAAPSEVIPGTSLSPYTGNHGITLGGNLTNNSTNIQTLNIGLNLSATRTIACASGHVVLGGVVSGGGGLTKSGANTLTLSGGNSFAGGVALGTGTLNLNHTSALGSTLGTFTITGGTTINNTSGAAITMTANNPQTWNGDFIFTGSNALHLGNGAIAMGAATRQVTVSASTLTLGGAIGGAGGLTKAGNGTLRLSGVSTYAGATDVVAGTLALGVQLVSGFGTTGTGWSLNGGAGVASDVLTITSNTNDQARSAFLTTRVPLGAFATSFTFQAGGNRAADGSVFVLHNDARGVTAVGSSGGSLAYAGIAPSAAIVLNIFNTNVRGTGYRTGGNQNPPYTSSAPVDLSGGNAIALTLRYDGTNLLSQTLRDLTTGDTWSTTHTVGNLATTTGGSSAYAGFTGATGGEVSTQQISNFSFNVGGNNLLPTTTALSIAAGATVDLGGKDQQVASLANHGGGGGSVTNNGMEDSSLTVNGSGSTTFAGVISDGGSNRMSLVKVGSSSFTLGGANTYTGATTVGAGALLVTGSIAAGSAVGVADTATLGGTGTVAGTISLSAGAILAPGTGGTTIATLATGALTYHATSVYSLDLNGTGPTADRTSSSGAVALDGTLTVASIANAAYLRTYTIVSGTAISGTFSGLANHTRFIQQGRTFLITYNTTTVTLTDLDPAYEWVWDGGGTNDNWTTAANWVNDVAPGLGAAVQFSGTTRLTPNNDFPTDTSFSSVTFNAGAGAFVMGGNRITLVGGVTNNDDSVQTMNQAMIMAATRTVNAASGNLVFGGVLSGAGGLTKTGNGTLILSTAANSYAGGTTISTGTLQVGTGTIGSENAAALGTGTVTIPTAGTLFFDPGSTDTIYNFPNSFSLTGGTIVGGDGRQHLATGGATFDVGASGGTLHVTWSAKDIFIDGVMTGSGPLAISPYGNTGAESGVWFNNAGNTYSGTITLTSAATTDVSLLINQPTALQFAKLDLVSGGGIPRVWIANNDVTTTIAGLSGNAGVVQGGWIAGAYPLVVNASVSATYGGMLTDGTGGALSLTKSGVGALTLSGANAYSGATTVGAGTLLVTGSTIAGSAVAVSSGATLGGSGTVAGTVTVANGGAIAPGTGGTTIAALTTGAVTLNASSVYSVNLNGTTPTFDQIASSGAVACAGTLTIASLSNAALNRTYTIVSAASVTGTFSGLANNAVFIHAGRLLRITYTATTVVLTDIAPVISSRQTLDTDGDGQIDRIRLTFDQNLNDDTSDLMVTVAGYTVSGFDVGVANDQVIEVLLTESGAGDTGATPSVRITANTMLADVTDTTLIQVEASGTAPTDAAAPVLLSSTWSDGGTGGVSAGDTLTLTFSESVTTTNLVVGDLDLPVSGDSLSTTTIADQTNATISMTLAGSPQLTPGGTYNVAALTAGDSSGIFIADPTAIDDAVGLSPAMGLAASARDVVGTNVLAIAWVTGGTAPKTWAVGSVALGAIANSTAASLNLALRNVGDHTADLAIAVTVSDPSGWSPAAVVGSNQFVLKADNVSLPATVPADPSEYELTLTAVDQSLASTLLSGLVSDFALWLRLPTTITVGGGLPQSLTVSVTASLPP